MSKSEKRLDNAEISTTPEKISRNRNRGKKRKRPDSESSTDLEDNLPENALEVEKLVHASAIKNNLDDASVKKILKKVVTNDHVLALVKLREEEENAINMEQGLQPKLTRAKMKELMKVSPKTGAPWTLELTPIKEIPVKTTPEVTALISQELQEDEDDEEYQPTHDDVPSDDDHTFSESCSDLDSLPRTPATPRECESPRVVQDGPFKVPQTLTPARKKLILDEEEATIALRTRSKLSLSATSIEHIENSFVPPDDLPKPQVDDLWSEFLMGCFNSSSVTRNEEDDEADPEYNVAADQDAHDEDEEALESSIIKISRKELNDLVTELFNVMPEAADEPLSATELVGTVFPEPQAVKPWEGKQEPLSDDESSQRVDNVGVGSKPDTHTRFSIGKSEPPDPPCPTENNGSEPSEAVTPSCPPPCVSVLVKEVRSRVSRRAGEPAPRVLRAMRDDQLDLHIHVDQPIQIHPEQIQILQQQLRQHIQVAASNFLQLVVDPLRWQFGPPFKEYLEQLYKLGLDNPSSVVNVCNLKPAIDLINSWEKTVSKNTPENQKLVQFMQNEYDKSVRRYQCNNIYNGEFHETFLQVVANSTVFLYPYLLPSTPYRPEGSKRFGYRISEDNLIVLGLDQFWEYIDSNPTIYKPQKVHSRKRWGLAATCELVCKHMMPWLTPRVLLGHIYNAKKDKDGPIAKYFTSGHIEPVRHKLLPFNPSLTLYEQPEHEMPRIWVRYLAKSSKRFRDHLYKRKHSGLPPINGVEVNMGEIVETPEKLPLPIDFTKQITSNKINNLEKIPELPIVDKFDVHLEEADTAKENVFLVLDRKVQKIKPNVRSTVKNFATILTPTDNINNNGNVSNEISKSNQNSNEISSTTNDIPIIVNSGAPTKYRLVQTSTGTFLLPPTLVSNSNNTTSLLDTINDKTTNHIESTEETLSETTNKNKETNSTANLTNNVSVIINSGTPMSYQLVETSTGAFLLPQTLVHNLDKTRPLLSVNETNSQRVTLSENDSESIHCKCCKMLQRICKKQTLITEFFAPKMEEKCECKDRKYPKMSKRLRMLLNNYQSKSWCVHKELQTRIKMAKNDDVDDCDNDVGSKDFTVDDIAAVTSYQMKLTIRTSFIRKSYLKKQVYNFFSRYNPAVSDPLSLAEQLYKAFEVELVDLYKEFLGFLTAVQADSIGKFKDYFIQSCIERLMKKIDEEVKDKKQLAKILSQVQSIYEDSSSTACEICCGILATMGGQPSLARYLFSLFPHKVTPKGNKDKNSCNQTQDCDNQDKTDPKEGTTIITEEEDNRVEINVDVEQPVDMDQDAVEESELTIRELSPSHMERDEGSSSDADDTLATNYEDTTIDGTSNNSNDVNIKFEADEHQTDSPELTVDEDQIEEQAEFNDNLVIVTEDQIKAEPVDWKRDEDKIILELLMRYLAEERETKTFLELIEEKNVYQTLSQSLHDKSKQSIRQRVMYLLEILIMNPHCNNL